MYNVRQKFKIQITIAIVVLVYYITLMQPNVPKGTLHYKFIYGTSAKQLPGITRLTGKFNLQFNILF